MILESFIQTKEGRRKVKQIIAWFAKIQISSEVAQTGGMLKMFLKEEEGG